MRRGSSLVSALAPLIWLALPGLSAAQDEPITLADDPFEVTDPRATPLGTAVFSLVGSYERAARGRFRDTYGAETEMGLGVAPNLDLRLGQVGAYGNLDVRRRLGTFGDGPGTFQGEGRAALGGTTRLGALYQVSDDRAGVPAVGLLGRVRALYGPGGTAYDTDVVALFSKTLRDGPLPLGISVNVGLASRLDPRPGERPHRAFVNASIGQSISRDTALVATYAREQQERGDQDFSLVQVGLRHRLRDRKAVLGLAAGFGLNRDSPQFQVAAAVQWEISTR